MVEAMDCEVIVRSTLKDKSEWVMKQKEEAASTVDLDALLSDVEEVNPPKKTKKQWL